MKVSSPRRKKKISAIKSIQKNRTVEENLRVDISLQVAKVRSSFELSRSDFAARAAKAREILRKSTKTVMLG